MDQNTGSNTENNVLLWSQSPKGMHVNEHMTHSNSMQSTYTNNQDEQVG